jgi:predicted PurR-regulated permease PerM
MSDELLTHILAALFAAIAVAAFAAMLVEMAIDWIDRVGSNAAWLLSGSIVLLATVAFVIW